MDAVVAGSADGLSRGELNEEMSRIEKELRRRLPIGWSTSYQSLEKEFVSKGGYSGHALERTLFILEKREVIRFSGQVSRWRHVSPEPQLTCSCRKRSFIVLVSSLDELCCIVCIHALVPHCCLVIYPNHIIYRVQRR